MFETKEFDTDFGEGAERTGVCAGAGKDHAADDKATRSPIPDTASIDGIAPGLRLAGALAATERESLSGHDLVRLLQGEARQVAHYQAAMYSTMAGIASREEIEDEETAASEIAAALHLTRQASETELWTALDLEDHPDVRTALSEGRIDWRRANVILHHVAQAEIDLRQSIITRVLPDAPRMTTGQLRSRLRKLSITVDPSAARNAYESGLEERRIVVEPNPGGTANLLVLNAPPTAVAMARQRLEALARSAGSSDHPRTLDQLRADTALDVLIGRDQGKAAGVNIDIVVDLPTLMGMADNPAEIPGFGPVIAEIARKAAVEDPGGTWTGTVLDHGAPGATMALRRRPTAGMKRWVRALHPTCIHRGYRHPASKADIDHTKEWSKGGQTALRNLVPLCEYHHKLKDKGWSYSRRPDGSFRFISPMGHRYSSGNRSP